MINYDQFRERLFSQRMEEKISQSQLARRSGVAVAQISRYESGKSNPREDIIAKLADGLNVNFEWLAYGKEPKISFEETEKKSALLTLNVRPEIIDIISTLSKMVGVPPSEYARLTLESSILEEWGKIQQKNNPITSNALNDIFTEKVHEVLLEQFFSKPKSTILTASQEEIEEVFKSTPQRPNKKDR